MTGNSTWDTVLGTKAFKRGRHYWEIDIIDSPSNWIMLGVTIKSHTPTNYVGSGSGWGWAQNKSKYGTSQAGVQLPTYTKGDTIGTLLDM
jgi:hypothetical protein